MRGHRLAAPPVHFSGCSDLWSGQHTQPQHAYVLVDGVLDHHGKLKLGVFVLHRLLSMLAVGSVQTTALSRNRRSQKRQRLQQSRCVLHACM